MRKGITPVIAVILLLLITISIVGIAFTFFQRTTEAATTTGSRQIEQQVSQIGTQFAIDGVDKNRVYIRNIGTSPLSNLKFYVNNVDVNYTGPASLAPNSVGAYTLNATIISILDNSELRVGGTGVSDKIVINFQNELLVNPGFENGVSEWLIAGDVAAHSADTTTAHSGIGSGKISNSPSYCNDYFYQDIPVTPNTDYAFSGWIKKTATTTGPDGNNYPGIWVTQRDAGGYPWVHLAIANLTSGEYDWTQLAINFNSRSNTILRFSFFMWWCSPGNTGSIWYDDAKLFKLY